MIAIQSWAQWRWRIETRAEFRRIVGDYEPFYRLIVRLGPIFICVKNPARVRKNEDA